MILINIIFSFLVLIISGQQTSTTTTTTTTAKPCPNDGKSCILRQLLSQGLIRDDSVRGRTGTHYYAGEKKNYRDTL